MSTNRIDWKRAESIFGPPAPFTSVNEVQLDGHDSLLSKLASTPWQEIRGEDLWVYFQDLAHVELQRSLFAYLFPVCLMDWFQTLLSNEACERGDTEFHFALHSGRVLDTVLTSGQRRLVLDFFRDGLFDRLDREASLVGAGSGGTAHGWLHRMNSIGQLAPVIEEVLCGWWSVDSSGHAIAALQYVSGLMYRERENPFFAPWSPVGGGGGPYLWQSDSCIFDAGWLPANLEALARRLTPTNVADLVSRAARRLIGHAEAASAARIESDLPSRMDLVEKRCRALPLLLQETNVLRNWTD